MSENFNEYSQPDISMLFKELEASKMMHEQIRKLTENSDLHSVLPDILECVGKYLGAERVYIFEKNKDTTYSNTYEWCAEGITAEIDNLQNLPPSEFMSWIEAFERNEIVVIPDIEEIRDSQPELYSFLAPQNIKSVVEAPIKIGNETIGFIGVDNAHEEYTKLISDSLEMLGSFIGVTIKNQQEKQKLVKSHNELSDSLDIRHEMLSSITCGVFAYTLPEYDLITINNEARRIIGCGDNDDPMLAFSRFLNERIFPDDRKRIIEDAKCLVSTGDSMGHSFKVNENDKVKHIRSNTKLLSFSNGQKYILCSILDNTEQVNLTTYLAKKRKSYRDALDNGSEFNFFFNVSDGLIRERFVTAHGIDLIKELGYSLPVSFDEIMKKYIESFELDFASDSMRKNFTCAGLIESFNSGITNAVAEYYNPKRDLYIRVNCLLSLDDETGQVHAYVVAYDISEIRKKEQMQKEALSAANSEMIKRLDVILDGITGGLKIIDVEDNYSYSFINEGASLLQGYSVNEFLEKFGKSIISNIHPEDGEAALEEAKRQIREKGFFSVKYRVPHRDGSIKWVIDRGKPVADPVSGKTLWYTLMQDVTELEERNNQLGNAIAMQEQMSDSLGTGILAYTLPDHRILLFNQEAKRIFGCDESDLNTSGDLLLRYVIPEDLKNMSITIQELNKPGDNVEYFLRTCIDDGVIRSVRCNTKLLSFPNGKLFILSSVIDITEQVLMEKRIDAERRQYRNALNYGTESVLSFDLTKRIINEKIVTYDGRDLISELGLQLPVTYDTLARNWFSEKRVVIDPAYKDKLQILTSRDRLIEAAANGNFIRNIEYYVPSIGKYYRILIVLYKLLDNYKVNFFIYDVTSSRHEERQRRSVIESLGKIYSSLYLLSLKRQSYTAFLQRDDTALELKDRGILDEFRNIYVNKFVADEFKDKLTEFLSDDFIRTNLRQSDFVNIEFRRNGLGWCRLTLAVSERDDSGEIISVVFAGSIIEAAKQAELAQQEALRAAYESANIANSAKTDFLANMSHDIRTPMNAIIGLTAIAGTHLDNRERVSDCLSKITVSSKHLLGIINEVLDMSKIEAGKLDLLDDEFNMPDLLDNLLTMSKPEVDAKHHELTVKIRGIEHENVIGDSQRIQQVFMNIMSNAIKYTPPHGKLALTVSEKFTNTPRVGCYEFIFEDNGFGMSEEYLEHIFEPFSRARSDNRIDKIQGTGLGMPITKNIVQMMNGEIKVESKLNVGTKITVTFFLKLRDNDEPVTYDKFIGLPVLVADDDESACIYTCQLLSEMGMKGTWVQNGREAVDQVKERHNSGSDFFAVILDWKMPEMDGLDAVREIRKTVGKHVPIITTSAYDWSDIEFEARAAGVNAFISKPLFKSRMLHLFSELVKDGSEEQHTSELEEFAKERFDGRRALLVEDNELNAEIATEILTMVGLEIEHAHDGKEAVDIMTSVEENYFDIVFMDIQMPVMNGYEASRAIRTLPSDYARSVPILAMTANAFAEDVAAAKNAGMNEHIAKPLDLNQLLRALKKWLK